MSRPPGDTGVEKTTVTVDKDFAHFLSFCLSVWGSMGEVLNLFGSALLCAGCLSLWFLVKEGEICLL